MYEPKIILSGAPNARDLGGIETKDGRTLKYGRLIRSGMLSRLDDNDIAYLKNAGLRTVVDFRTAAERMQIFFFRINQRSVVCRESDSGIFAEFLKFDCFISEFRLDIFFYAETDFAFVNVNVPQITVPFRQSTCRTPFKPKPY